MTQPKTDLAYLRNEKAKAEQKLRSCQHREKILERQMSELNRRERVHRVCTRAGMLESFLVCPGELTDDQVMELLKISFRQPEVVLALAKMVHDVHERSNVQNPFRWVGEYDITADEMLSGIEPQRETKTQQAKDLICALLAGGKQVFSEDIDKAALERGIPGRTVRDAKRELGDALKSKIVEGRKKVFWME